MTRLRSTILRGALTGLLFFCVFSLWAQDNQTAPTDSGRINLPNISLQDQQAMRWGEPYTPRKAGLLSAAMPGLGQIYNQSYWKLGLVYGAVAGAGYYSYLLNDRYAFLRSSLFAAIDNDPLTINDSGFSEAQLRSLSDRYRRDRDLSYIILGFVYLLNIAEAHIDAHLKDFNLEDDIMASRTGIQVRPLVVSQPGYSGVGIRFVFP